MMNPAAAARTASRQAVDLVAAKFTSVDFRILKEWFKKHAKISL